MIFILTKKNPESMEDKKAISMKILSTDEKGYNFEFSIVGNHGLYRFKYDPKTYPGTKINYYFVIKFFVQ